MKVICVETIVQCVFGVLDDDGDVGQKQPFRLEVPKPTPELFAEAQKAIVERKRQLEQQVAAPAS